MCVCKNSQYWRLACCVDPDVTVDGKILCIVGEEHQNGIKDKQA